PHMALPRTRPPPPPTDAIPIAPCPAVQFNPAYVRSPPRPRLATTIVPRPHITLLILAVDVCDSDGMAGGGPMKDRTHFEHRLDMYGSGDEVVEHLAGIEDYLLALATYH